MRRNATDEFIKTLRDFNDFLENPGECLIEHKCDPKTYTVVITGLGYIDAQNIVEMGLEYGQTVNFSVEGEEDGEDRH